MRLDLGSGSSLSMSLVERLGLGAKGGLVEDVCDVWGFSSEVDFMSNSRGELELSWIWNVPLDQDFTVGLDLESRSSLGISWDGNIVCGDKGGWGGAGGDVCGGLNLKEAPVLKSDRLILLVLDLKVGLDGGLVEELLSSSVSDFLLLLECVLKLRSDWGGRLDVELWEGAGVCSLSTVHLVVQSLLPPLARRKMSLEESILGEFGSDGFLLSEETLDGRRLSSEFWLSLRPSLFSL